jgi:ubiquinone/menaquinone biosynthesis C-methylase UbiE
VIRLLGLLPSGSCSAKIAPGMRVLDLACGAGDVAMLAAHLAGETGSVVGIDRHQEVLALASRRFGSANTKELKWN